MSAVASLSLRLTSRDWIHFVSVFAVYFLSAWLCLHLYFSVPTAPAIIWAPVGIALAAVIFGGYRMWISIFLAQFAIIALQFPSLYLLAFIVAAAYTLQSVLGLYVLRRFRFDPSFEHSRNVLIFVLAAIIITMVEPAIFACMQFLGGMPLSGLSTSFGDNWSTGIFSVLVITPFIITWWHDWDPSALPRRRLEALELLGAFLLLLATIVFIFWTPYIGFFGISIIFFLPAVLLWFALRLHPRWMTLAIALTAAIGLAGTLVTGADTAHIASQLLTDEIYIGLIAGIFLLFVSLVGERRIAFERLAVKFEATSAADEAKGRFIAILAHELRNPLAPLVSSLELLQLEPQTQEAQEAIENAQAQTTMMRRLLDDLLDTARLSQDKLTLHKALIDIRTTLEESVASVQDFMKSQGHTLATAMPAHPIMLDADPVRLKQIIINLLNNAAKYTLPGGTINLSCHIEDGVLVIRVADNGIGLMPETLEDLFEPFRQAALPRNDRLGTGLGLGLFLTKQLVTMHDGTIEAESGGADRGSVFTVRLPLPTQAAMTHLETVPSSAPGEKRILLVDDNAAFVSAMQKLLAHHGHVVREARSGEEALALLPAFRPDVIVLDIGMPGMNGYATAEHIRALGWRGMIIALSGYGQEADRRQSVEAGFDHHLVKPAGVNDILALFT